VKAISHAGWDLAEFRRRDHACIVRMPSHQGFGHPAALDSAVGAGKIGGNAPTGAEPSDSNSVHTDSATAHTDLALVPSGLVAVPMDSALMHTESAPVSSKTRSEA
jgi:hypothetical protein